jgi:dihydroneopterin aldolase
MAVSTWTEPVTAPPSQPPLLQQKILVRTLRVEARIGIHPHEQDHPQVLIVDVEIETQPRRVTKLSETLNYEAVVQAARAIAGSGHIDLVETFADRLACACLDMPGAREVRVRVLKPSALQPDAEAAGVEIRVGRATP